MHASELKIVALTQQKSLLGTPAAVVLPGIRPLNAAWAGPGGSPSFSTYNVLSTASIGSIDTL